MAQDYLPLTGLALDHLQLIEFYFLVSLFSGQALLLVSITRIKSNLSLLASSFKTKDARHKT